MISPSQKKADGRSDHPNARARDNQDQMVQRPYIDPADNAEYPV